MPAGPTKATANGDFNTASTWVGGVVPTTSGADLYGHHVTSSTPIANCLQIVDTAGTKGDLTLNTGASLTTLVIKDAHVVVALNGGSAGSPIVINANIQSTSLSECVTINMGAYVSGIGNISVNGGTGYGLYNYGNLLSWIGNVQVSAGKGVGNSGTITSWYGDISVTASGVYGVDNNGGTIVAWYGDIYLNSVATTPYGVYLHNASRVNSWCGNVAASYFNGLAVYVTGNSQIDGWVGNIDASNATYSNNFGLFVDLGSTVTAWYGNLSGGVYIIPNVVIYNYGTCNLYASVSPLTSNMYSGITLSIAPAAVKAAWEVMMYGGNVYAIASSAPNPTTIGGYLITSAKTFQLATGTGTIVDPSVVLAGAAGYPTGTRVDCPAADARQKASPYYGAGGNTLNGNLVASVAGMSAPVGGDLGMG